MRAAPPGRRRENPSVAAAEAPAADAAGDGGPAGLRLGACSGSAPSLSSSSPLSSTPRRARARRRCCRAARPRRRDAVRSASNASAPPTPDAAALAQRLELEHARAQHVGRDILDRLGRAFDPVELPPVCHREGHERDRVRARLVRAPLDAREVRARGCRRRSVAPRRRPPPLDLARRDQPRQLPEHAHHFLVARVRAPESTRLPGLVFGRVGRVVVERALSRRHGTLWQQERSLTVLRLLTRPDPK